MVISVNIQNKISTLQYFDEKFWSRSDTIISIKLCSLTIFINYQFLVSNSLIFLLLPKKYTINNNLSTELLMASSHVHLILITPMKYL